MNDSVDSRYEQSRMNWPALLSCEIFCIAVSLAVAYLVHFGWFARIHSNAIAVHVIFDIALKPLIVGVRYNEGLSCYFSSAK